MNCNDEPSGEVIYNNQMNTDEKRKLTVGVMRGGPSGEYEVSLKTGGNVANALRDRHIVRDIYIDRQGKWHVDGIERAPERILPHVDVVFNALHGEYGEDGRVQQILDSHRVPYTGSKSLPSAIGMNKWLSKKFFREHKLNVPRGVLLRPKGYDDDTLKSILDDFHGVVIVKPNSSGSSLGVSVARDFYSFYEALKNTFSYSPDAIVEEYIFGREATCGVVEGSEEGVVYALPAVEIRNLSENKEMWSYDAKYADELHELVCPGNFTAEEKWAIEDAAVRAHNALGLNHYSRVDFMLSPRGIFVLEVNTLPGLTSASLMPKALSAAGIGFQEFLDHVIDLALRK